MLYTSHDALSRKFRSSVNSPVGSDLLFLVGEERAKYYGHSQILAIQSEYFARMLDGHWKESSEKVIEKPNTCPQTFFKILTFLYCGEIELDDSDVVDILVSADEMDIRELIQICEKYILSTLNEANLLQYMNVLMVLPSNSISRLKQQIETFAEEKADEILRDSAYLDLNEDLVRWMVTNENLRVNEKELFTYIVNWGKRQLGIDEDVYSLKDHELARLRSLISPFLEHIRYCSIPIDEFEADVEATNLLSPETVLLRYKYGLLMQRNWEKSRTSRRVPFSEIFEPRRDQVAFPDSYISCFFRPYKISNVVAYSPDSGIIEGISSRSSEYGTMLFEPSLITGERSISFEYVAESVYVVFVGVVSRNAKWEDIQSTFFSQYEGLSFISDGTTEYKNIRTWGNRYHFDVNQVLTVTVNMDKKAITFSIDGIQVSRMINHEVLRDKVYFAVSLPQGTKMRLISREVEEILALPSARRPVDREESAEEEVEVEVEDESSPNFRQRANSRRTSQRHQRNEGSSGSSSSSSSHQNPRPQSNSL